MSAKTMDDLVNELEQMGTPSRVKVFLTKESEKIKRESPQKPQCWVQCKESKVLKMSDLRKELDKLFEDEETIVIEDGNTNDKPSTPIKILEIMCEMTTPIYEGKKGGERTPTTQVKRTSQDKAYLGEKTEKRFHSGKKRSIPRLQARHLNFN